MSEVVQIKMNGASRWTIKTNDIETPKSYYNFQYNLFSVEQVEYTMICLIPLVRYGKLD